MSEPVVICGFPGVGKSYVVNLKVYDLDPCEFSGENRFKEYADKIIDIMSCSVYGYSYIFVSTHKELRSELINRGVPYIIVAPYPNLKNEYLKNYFRRGSRIDFISKMSDHWEKYMNDIAEDPMPVLYLDRDEYLLDILPL